MKYKEKIKLSTPEKIAFAILFVLLTLVAINGANELLKLF